MNDRFQADRLMRWSTSESAAAEQRSKANSAEFPSARYFQIHFEALHDELGALRRQVEELNQRVTALSATAGQEPTAATTSDKATQRKGKNRNSAGTARAATSNHTTDGSS